MMTPESAEAWKRIEDLFREENRKILALFAQIREPIAATVKAPELKPKFDELELQGFKYTSSVESMELEPEFSVVKIEALGSDIAVNLPGLEINLKDYGEVIRTRGAILEIESDLGESEEIILEIYPDPDPQIILKLMLYLKLTSIQEIMKA